MMADCGQMSVQTPQPVQMTSSTSDFPFSWFQIKPGHLKIRVQSRAHPQASPLHFSGST
jgi:hypothetical protein